MNLLNDDLRQLHLQANEKGRDFVCGDLHGSFTCVMRFLDEIGFNKTTDRLFCVGDLVDRGPGSEECLTLLYEHWFFSVYANHEEMAVAFAEAAPIGSLWMRNGGLWAAKYIESFRREAEQDLSSLEAEGDTDIRDWVFDTIRNKVANLPHLITVEKRDGGRFHIIHAELPKVMGITDEVLADPQRAERALMKRDSSNGMVDLLWSRQLFGMLSKQHIDQTDIRKAVRAAELRNFHLMFSPELSHIYSGHTIVKQPLQFYGQTNLDTMAYASYMRAPSPWAGLTVTEPATGKFWFVNDHEFKQVEVLVVA